MEEVGTWREKEELLRGREKALGKVGNFKCMEATRMQEDEDHCVGEDRERGQRKGQEDGA